MQAVSKPKTELITVDFSYNTASPMILLNIPPNTWVDKCDISITDEFDDLSATLEVGTVANPDLLLGTAENIPSVKGDYSSDINHLITLAEILRLIINPGTSTKGSGTVFLTVRR